MNEMSNKLQLPEKKDYQGMKTPASHRSYSVSPSRFSKLSAKSLAARRAKIIQKLDYSTVLSLLREVEIQIFEVAETSKYMESNASKDPKLASSYKELIRKVENDRKVRKYMMQKERDRIEEERRQAR